MTKLSVILTIRFSEKQAESLQKLKDYDVNVMSVHQVGNIRENKT